MFMAWPDWTEPVRFCMLGPGETSGEDPDVSWPSYIRVAHLVRHVAFLLSLLHLSHYKGALNVSKYLISSVSEWVCCADDGWLGVGWVLEMPTAVPHPFPLTAFVLSSFPVVPP